jgi:glycosyltransferase involved in cell wall biosynthesis
MNAQAMAWPKQAMSSEVPEKLVLSVIVPALNEERSIAGIVEQILATQEELLALGIGALEVIVVDDGSEDKTARIVEEMPDVQLVRHRANHGYGAAIKSGFRKANGHLLAFLDADSTYPPQRLVQLCEIALRRLGNLIWSLLLSMIGSEKVQDPASGMRVIWRRCLPQLYPLPDGLNFTPVMSTRALHEGLKVVEIPIPYHERSGHSKLRVMRDGFKFLMTILWTALQYNPARLLELAGFCSLAIAAVMGLMLVAARLAGITELGPWGVFAVFAGLIFAVGGVSAFALGISFNYLVALLHRHPIRQVTLIEKIAGVSPEKHFTWIGACLIIGGTVMGILSLIFGLKGWQITRLWFYQLGSALFLLAGMQFVLFRMLIRVMHALKLRQERVGEDLFGSEAAQRIPAHDPAEAQA